MTLEFLKRLLNAPGPSTQEARQAKVWRDEVHTEVRNRYLRDAEQCRRCA